jgi:hypothetical protein
MAAQDRDLLGGRKFDKAKLNCNPPQHPAHFSCYTPIPFNVEKIACLGKGNTSDSRLQDFLGTLQSFEAYTPKIPGQGYFIFPEIPGVHVNSP